ncbi:MAG: MFS transporter [Rickettsiaceae bacterium]|nr:MAG: MFS transporter [Rickettsiaceae bacterium]
MSSKPKSVFLSAILGNILEYYDFTVYSVFAGIIGYNFFPNESEFLQTLASLGAFAVGFITRPIGGILFGYIGDKYGRRVSLIISMLGMTIPTFIIGLIPSYDSIGLKAPFILILMRLIQGLCISGEGAGAAIFILEHHQNLRPGFTAGLVHGSNIAGTLIATFIGILIESYFPDVDFAWRYAFLFGGFMGLVGFYLRLKVSETPIFQMLAEKKKKLNTPFIYVLKTARRPMFITFCVAMVASSVLYLVKTYVNIYYHNIMGADNTTSLIYLSYASFIAMVSMPLFGGAADIFGKFKMIVIASLAIIILSLPTLILMSSSHFWLQMLSLTCLGILGGGISGSAYIFIISLFTAEQKFSGVAFSYNLGIAMFGGTSPIISRWLVEKTKLFYAPSFYIITTATIFLIVIYLMKDSIKNLLKDNR